MADTCTQNFESHNIFDSQKNDSDVIDHSEQNRKFEDSEAADQQHPRATSEKLEINCQQPNQDEAQSAQSNTTQKISEIKVESENIQIEVIQESPRFNNSECSPNKVNEQSVQVETSKEATKSQSDNVVTVKEFSQLSPVDLSITVNPQLDDIQNQHKMLNYNSYSPQISYHQPVEVSVSQANEVVTFEELNNLKTKVDRILSQSLVNTYSLEHKTVETPLKSYYVSAFTGSSLEYKTVEKPQRSDYDSALPNYNLEYKTVETPLKSYYDSVLPSSNTLNPTNLYSKPTVTFSGSGLYNSQIVSANSYLTLTPVPQTKHINDIITTEKARISYHGYSSSASYLPTSSNFKPNYDKNKLDEIISRVVGTRSVITNLKPVTTFHSLPRAAETLKKSVAVLNSANMTLENQKRPYCGIIEDDVESVVLPHADEPSGIYEEEIVVPIQPNPRELKTPKRIEIINARKQRLGLSAVQSSIPLKKVEGCTAETQMNNFEVISSQNDSSAKKIYLVKSPKKSSVSHHREHGRQNSIGWSATILESPSRTRISAQHFEYKSYNS